MGPSEVPPGLTDLDAEVRIRGDLDLEPELWEKAGVKATKPAAVLVPVVARAEPMVLLTQRTPELKSHSGQIAFPGGKIDADDKSPLDAALREAEEEIGLERSFIDPISSRDCDEVDGEPTDHAFARQDRADLRTELLDPDAIARVRREDRTLLTDAGRSHTSLLSRTGASSRPRNSPAPGERQPRSTQ